MRFVSLNDGQMYPEASPSGDQGDLLDTGWDVLWPGPARVYLSEADLRDIVVTAEVLAAPLVFEALTMNGWVPADVVEAREAEFDALVLALTAERDAAVEKAETLETALGWRPLAVAGTASNTLAAAGAASTGGLADG